MVGDPLGHGAAARPGDGARGERRLVQGRWAQGVAVGKGRLLARDGPHAHALIDRKAAGFHHALIQAPGLGLGVLEVQVGMVHLVAMNLGQRRVAMGLCEPVGLQQNSVGNGQRCDGGIGWCHESVFLGEAHATMGQCR